MDSFPSKELPVHVGQLLADAMEEGEQFGLAPWLQALIASDPDAAPVPVPLPGAAERTLALATIWSEAKYNFAYWDQLPGEAWWDRCFQEYLPPIQAAETEREYWDLLTRFTRLLDDGHTGIILPHHLRRLDTTPPLRLQDVEGRAVVVEGALLPPGTQILAVDGVPVEELRTRLEATIESATDHYTKAASAARLLSGPRGTPVTLLARRWDGSEFEVTLQRTGPLRRPDRVEVTTLGEGRFRVAINSMGEPEVAEAFHRRFPDFDGVTGLVLDLRRNGGGSTEVANSILARLLTAPAQSERTALRTYIPAYRAWGGHQRWLVAPPELVRPDPSRPTFAGPVAVLCGPFTASAAEDFLVTFKAAKRGPIVGQPSCGSTGQPLTVPLPGGGAFRVCCKRDTMPDGEVFVGKGIQPDIPCAPTLAGVASGRDEALEAAVHYLHDGRNA
ncbi:MAG TPA: S41 family peptidase [Symbiobacteriaceae bacterium]|nr:S41 family peptidase [Symbiobacteriaceae bacterium]